MKLGFGPNDFNATSVEFDVNVLVPPLLVSSLTGLCLLNDFSFFYVPGLDTLDHIDHICQL